MSVEKLEYNGYIYRRYPNAKNSSDRRYFKRTKNKGTQVDYLHHAIYRDHHGEIPEGYHVHHKDGDSTNNDPSNLEAIPAFQHLSYHGKQNDVDLEHLERIRPLTKKWHASKEGREWHKDHGKKTWEARQSVIKQCDECGKEFDSISRRDNDRFCSNPCKSKWRRKSGLDDEERTCVICGNVFTVNKYEKVRTCSKPCKVRAWRESKYGTTKSV